MNQKDLNFIQKERSESLKWIVNKEGLGLRDAL